jgi:hypothetical protein
LPLLSHFNPVYTLMPYLRSTLILSLIPTAGTFPAQTILLELTVLVIFEMPKHKVPRVVVSIIHYLL